MTISGKCKCNLVRVMDVANGADVAEVQERADKRACESCPDCNPDYKPLSWEELTRGGYHVSEWDRRR